MKNGRIKPENPPPPEYAFGYRHPPRSGNEINGLGESTRRQPRHVFHSAGGPPLDWQALDDFFGLISPWSVLRHVIGNAWQLRNKDGPVNPEQREVADAAGMAIEIKERARQLGADLAGVSRITDGALYEGIQVPFKYAISIGMKMDREQMAHVPQVTAAAEVMRVYKEISRVAVRLAKQIRNMGWPARAYGNPNSTDILQIPLAVNAGFGQLGKHGSMISKEFGSNFRLAAVLTDLPMACDEPVDIGVDDLCLSCRRCVTDCPPDAIFDEKQLIRGEKRWYVDFDKCIPYFVKTNGCAICIEVCPWSVPDRGPSLSAKMLAKRGVRVGSDRAGSESG
ncbi:MAG: 4Fe-4S dicluster domain-containing protein [Gammaproteobacteria bacterium]|nr:4Fe-4S dicluster domain-containing protein [Gammaproteobacteria bacterium]